MLWKRPWVLKSKAGVLLAAEDEEGREGKAAKRRQQRGERCGRES